MKRSCHWHKPVTSSLRFYFLDDKSGFEQSNVLSKIRLITFGSILCTPPSYLPMVSTLTISNDVMVFQYDWLLRFLCNSGVPGPLSILPQKRVNSVAIFFHVTWILLQYLSSTSICQT